MTSRTLRQTIRVTLFTLVASVLLLTAAPPSHAQFKTKARTAILVDVTTGAILFQKNPDEMIPPASMSKLMTLALIYQGLKRGTLKLDDEIYNSENAWRTGGAPSGTAAMFLSINKREKLSELIKGIVIQSGNDAAIAIAEHMAGSEEAFARAMEQYARSIGMTRSTFGNATGLPHPRGLMTPRELALLAQHIIEEYPDQYALFADREFRYKRYRFFNRNPLIFMKIGADGLKTGYTKEAGYGLVGSAVQNGRRLIVVISGLESKADRKAEGARLLNYGFRAFKRLKIFDADTKVGSARVWGGSSFYVPLNGKGDITILVPKYAKKKGMKAEVVYNGPLKPPIKRGDRVAKLRVTTEGTSVNEVPLYAMEDVGSGSVIRKGLDTVLYMINDQVF